MVKKMMKRNLLLFLLLCFCAIPKVNAAKTYKTVIGDLPASVKVTLKGAGYVNKDGFNNSSGYVTGKPSVYYKHTTDRFAICTALAKDNNSSSTTCYKENKGWTKDNAVASGVAAIIIKSSGGLDADMSMTEYFNSEMAVNMYLEGTKYGTSANKNYGAYGITKDGNSSSLSKKINALAAVGTSAQQEYTDFETKPMNIKIGKITKNGNNNSYTAKISFSGVDEQSSNKYSKIEISNPTFELLGIAPETTYDYNSESKILTINNVRAGSTIRVKAKVTVKRTYYKAANYDCSKSSNNQSITLNMLEKAEQSRELSASNVFRQGVDSQGNAVAINRCNYRLNKVDSEGRPLAGSKFELSGSSGQDEVDFNYDNDEDVRNSYCFSYNEDNPDARFGQYTSFKELVAPEGYKLSERVYNFEEIAWDNDEFNIVNTANTSLLVYKKDGDTGAILGGAKLVLYKGSKVVKWEPEGEVSDGILTARIVGYEDIAADNLTDEQIANKIDEASWTTQENVKVKFVGLDYDSYIIDELAAPSKYIVNDSRRVVTLENADGKRDVDVAMTDYKTSVTISKQDITNSKEVPGAHLRIVYGQENVFAEWISTDTPKVIDMLPDGEYYLEETIAPEGYELETTKIPFVVKDGKTKSATIIMTNAPNHITVTNTLLSKRNIIYVIGGILILGGVGVLGYELKKRKNFSK